MSERMDLLVARQYTRNGETKTAFTRVGTAWQNTKGYSLVFEALPLPTINDKGVLETRVLMMPPRDNGGTAKPASDAPASGDDDVPW